LSLYSGKDLTANQFEDRTLLFEMLENHLVDLNAYCRCRVCLNISAFEVSAIIIYLKAIQGWTALVKAEIPPVKLLLQIIEKIIESTLDKSSYCRKDAIKFMKACLEHNPFSGNVKNQHYFCFYAS
jgi:hypothetical protein